jgi:hypothetical protein
VFEFDLLMASQPAYLLACRVMSDLSQHHARNRETEREMIFGKDGSGGWSDFYGGPEGDLYFVALLKRRKFTDSALCQMGLVIGELLRLGMDALEREWASSSD